MVMIIFNYDCIIVPFFGTIIYNHDADNDHHDVDVDDSAADGIILVYQLSINSLLCSLVQTVTMTRNRRFQTVKEMMIINLM